MERFCCCPATDYGKGDKCRQTENLQEHVVIHDYKFVPLAATAECWVYGFASTYNKRGADTFARLAA